MGFRVYRWIKVAPGVTVNLSKSGPSVSVGPTGAKTTVGPRGARGTVGVPGTGARYTAEHRWGSKKDAQATRLTATPQAKDMAVSDLSLWKRYLKTMQRVERLPTCGTRNFEDGLRLVDARKVKKAERQFARARVDLSMADMHLRGTKIPQAQVRMVALMRQGLAERVVGLTQLASACRDNTVDHLAFLAGRERYDSGDAYFNEAMGSLSPADAEHAGGDVTE